MNTTKLLVRLSVGIVIALSVVHCSPEQSTRMRRIGDNDVKSEEPAIVQQQVVKNAQLETTLNAVEPIVIRQMSLPDEEVSAAQLMQDVIIPLRQVILNREFLEDPNNRLAKTDSGREIMPRLVSLFNQSILLVDKTSDLLASTDLLDKYKELIFWDCYGPRLAGSCAYVEFFKSNDNVNMSRIALLIRQQESTTELEKIQLIRAAYRFKNRRLDAASRFMLLESVARRLDDKDDNRSAIIRKAEADLLANILQIESMNVENVSDSQIELVAAMGPLEMSRNVDNSKNPAMTDMIKLAAKHLLYKKEGGLTDDFKNRIVPSLLYKIGADYEQGVYFQQQNLKGEWKDAFENYQERVSQGEQVALTGVKAEVFPQLVETSNVDLYGPESKDILRTLLSDVVYNESVFDEYFYLAHQAFYAHFNLEDATAFWGGTNKNPVRLMDELEKLLKMQIVNNIVLTNTRMNEFYNRNENTKLIDLLRESDKEASKIRKAWSKTIVRAKSVKSLITRVVNPNTLSPEDRKAYDRINSSIDALKKNIKFLVTYPNMFPLMHVMASLEMKDTITFWGRKFTIESSTILTLFFEGHFPPWFNFGNDSDRLDPVEIVYTYYYALMTQTFETYSADSASSIVNFSHKDFFEVVVRRLILKEQENLDEERRHLSRKLQEYRNNATALKTICREEMRLQKVENEALEELKQKLGADFDWYDAMINQNVMKERRRIKNQVGFINLPTSVYDGTANGNDKFSRYLNEIYTSKPKQVFDGMRTEFPKVNIVAETIAEVFKIVKGQDLDVDEILRDQFTEYNRLKAEYVKLYMEAEDGFRECDWAFLNRDRDIRHILIHREKEYYGQLFDRVWDVLSPLTDEERQALSSGDEASLALEEIRKEFSTYTQDDAFAVDDLKPGYPEEYQARSGYNRITASRLTSFKMDTIARVYSYVQELFPGQYNVTMPADFKNARVYGENSPALVYFDWTKDKEEAKEAFISSGIKALADQMSWANVSPPLGTITEKGHILVNLYKLGTLTKNDEVDCDNADLTDDVREANCVRVTAKEVIDHFVKAIHFINLDDRDIEILNLLGKENKYSQDTYEDYIKRQDEHRLYSFYDMIFRRVYSDANTVQGAEETWFMDTLVKYVDSKHKIDGSTFIFPYSDEIERIYKAKYSGWLQDYYDRNREFIGEVKNQLAEGVESFRFKYRTDRTDTVGMGANEWSVNKRISLEPLISDLIYGKFEGYSQQMNNDTGGAFADVVNSYRSELKEMVKPAEEGDQ